jgi:hypothetical protein
MRRERITVPVIGGAAGYIIPDFEKGLGEFAAPASDEEFDGSNDRTSAIHF